MSNKTIYNKKKYNKKIIIVVLICIIIISILSIMLYNSLKVKKYEESIQEFQEFRKEYESQTILPRKIYELYDYNGDYDRDYLYKNMKVFVNYLDYLTDNLKEDDVEKFYSNQTSEIKEIIGISKQEEFKTFMKNVKSKNLKESEFNYAEIEAGSSYNQNGYFNFVLYLYYGEDSKPTKFSVSFANSKDYDIKVAYRFIEE